MPAGRRLLSSGRKPVSATAPARAIPSSSKSKNDNNNNNNESSDPSERNCVNPPIPSLDHVVMSKADRRRAAKNEQPATREERERARENLQILRREMRQNKKLGWRGKIRRERREAGPDQKRARTEFYSLDEDAAASSSSHQQRSNNNVQQQQGGGLDDEEARVVAQRLGIAAATGSSRSAQQKTSLKRHRAEDEW